MSGTRRRQALAAGLIGVALLLGLAAAPAAASPTAATGSSFVGSRVTPPDSDEHAGQFTDVSCPSSTRCVAVGDAIVLSGARVTIAQQWNGRAWSGMGRLPQIGPAGQATFAAVSCIAADACLAVGYFADAANARFPLAESWNGRAWHVVTSSGLAAGDLTAVSCTGPRSCMAVGSATGRSTAHRWDGREWHALTTPEPGRGPQLTDVSCAGVGRCTAVGSYVSGSAARPLIDSWDGRRWTQQRSPLPPGSTGLLLGVSCPTAGACTAVGELDTDGTRSILVENRQAGSAYHYGAPHPGLPGARLTAISCTGPFRCTAAGTYSPHATGGSPIVARRDSDTGFAAAAVTRPSTQGQFLGVACAGPTCELAGHFTVSGSRYAVAAAGHGTRTTQQPTVTPTTTSGGQLTDVSCPTIAFCMATVLRDGTGPQVFELSRDGGPWRVLPGPAGAPFTPRDGYSAVSCTSATFCLAVGYGTDRHVAATWDGTRWTAALAGDSIDGVDDVSCSSPTYCLAVGTYYDGSTQHDFVYVGRWDGQRWTTVEAGARRSTEPVAVSCPGPDSCTVIGTVDDVFIDRYSTAGGLQAESVPGETQDYRYVVPSSISCPDPQDCVAVATTPRGNRALVEDGGTWSLTRTAPERHQTRLYSVSCAATTSCVAVGSAPYAAHRPAGTPQFLGTPATVVERLDGSRWTQVSDGQPGGASSELFGVSCPGRCVAVGRSSAVLSVPFAARGA